MCTNILITLTCISNRKFSSVIPSGMKKTKRFIVSHWTRYIDLYSKKEILVDGSIRNEDKRRYKNLFLAYDLNVYCLLKLYIAGRPWLNRRSICTTNVYMLGAYAGAGSNLGCLYSYKLEAYGLLRGFKCRVLAPVNWLWFMKFPTIKLGKSRYSLYILSEIDNKPKIWFRDSNSLSVIHEKMTRSGATRKIENLLKIETKT